MDYENDRDPEQEEAWAPGRFGIAILTFGAAGGYFVACGLLAAMAWAAKCQDAGADDCSFLDSSAVAVAAGLGIVLIIAAGGCSTYMRRLWPLGLSTLVAFAAFVSLLIVA